MKTVVLPSPDTTFGRLKAIGEARTSSGRQAMLCLCECGQQKIVQVSKLVSGHTKSCGCLHSPPRDLTRRNPGEIPLYGKAAAGRVARIDAGDFELVSQYRWRAFVLRRRNGGIKGPYAITQITRPDGGRTSIRMHSLITGWPLVDHINCDGLDNRRENLRPATSAENARNARKTVAPTASQFKGVHWEPRWRRWIASIRVNRKSVYLGGFRDEAEAARAYDAAAREMFGEFARPNFPDEPAA